MVPSQTSMRPVLFRTLDGMPVPALSVAEMRKLDAIAAANHAPSLEDMMEAAGMNLAQFVGEQWPRALIVGPVVVLAGGGNNGAGGIAAAYHLQRVGADVRLCLVTPEARLSTYAVRQWVRYREAGGRVVSVQQLAHGRAFLIIDALIGYGLKGTPHGAVKTLIEWANAQRSPVVSLDMPSGLDADSGQCAGACMQADKTLTLALPKRGLIAACVGELWLADIGIGSGVLAAAGIKAVLPFVGENRLRLQPQRQESPILPGTPFV